MSVHASTAAHAVVIALSALFLPHYVGAALQADADLASVAVALLPHQALVQRGPLAGEHDAGGGIPGREVGQLQRHVAHGAGATALAPFSAGGSLIVGGTISPPLGGSPAKGDFVWLKFWRAAADANDTITVNATLLGLMLLWNSDAETDA